MALLEPPQAPGGALNVAHPIVAGQVLPAGPRQGLVEALAATEGLPVGVERHLVPVPGQGDIGGVAIHDGIGQNVHLVHGRPLALWIVTA